MKTAILYLLLGHYPSYGTELLGGYRDPGVCEAQRMVFAMDHPHPGISYTCQAVTVKVPK